MVFRNQFINFLSVIDILLRDLERTVDVLKSDVVKRKVRLDPVQLESMEKELQSYTEKVSHMNCK